MTALSSPAVAGLTGTPTTDNHVMKQVPLEALLYNRLRQICPTIRDVCVTDAGGGYHVVVSIRPTFTTQARDVMLAALTTERLGALDLAAFIQSLEPRDHFIHRLLQLVCGQPFVPMWPSEQQHVIACRCFCIHIFLLSLFRSV